MVLPVAWATVKVLPAIVAVPVRCDEEVFAVHETVTDPEPVPLADETVSQEPFPEAVQFPPVQPVAQPVTVTLLEPAEAVALAEAGEIVKTVQVGADVGGLQWNRGPAPPHAQFGMVVP